MPTSRCPTCDAPIEIGAEDIVTVCPYCSTCFKLDGAVVKEHYLMPSFYSSSDAAEKLILWIKKQVGAPEDLPVHLEILGNSLGYYPFWHLNVDTSTTFSGVGEDATYGWPVGPNTYREIHTTSKPETGSLRRQLTLTYPASKHMPKELLNYEFPTRSKKYFSQAYSKQMGGRIYNSCLAQEEAEQMAKTQAENVLGQLIAQEVFTVNSRQDQINITSVFYLHAPVWHIQYKVEQKAYEAFIDASTGRIVHATYPIGLEHRAKHGAIAASHYAVAAIALLGLMRIAQTTAVALALGAGAIGTVFLIRALQFGRGKEKAK